MPPGAQSAASLTCAGGAASANRALEAVVMGPLPALGVRAAGHGLAALGGAAQVAFPQGI